MNVALFVSAFYPSVGGVEEHVRQFARICSDQCVCPIVITNRWPRSLPRYEVVEGVPVYRLALRVPDVSLKARINYMLTRHAVQRKVKHILARHKIDLIHVHCVSSNGLYALCASRALNLPLVVTTHGERTMDATGLYQHSAFMNHVLRQLLTEADYITACSQHTLADMEQYFGQPFGKRARVVYNGIQASDFEHGEPFAHPRPYLLGIGRLVPQKGFDILIRAFAQATLPNYDLLLAGEGTEKPALQTLVASLNLQSRVKFIGQANRDTVVSLFKGCVFFVLPSRQEPFGIVNLEAMAAGKAIVASRVGGVPEIVQDGRNGLLVPTHDVGALALTMMRLAADPELQQRLEQAGQRYAQQFAWPAIAENYFEVYNLVSR